MSKIWLFLTDKSSIIFVLGNFNPAKINQKKKLIVIRWALWFLLVLISCFVPVGETIKSLWLVIVQIEYLFAELWILSFLAVIQIYELVNGINLTLSDVLVFGRVQRVFILTATIHYKWIHGKEHLTLLEWVFKLIVIRLMHLISNEIRY